MSTTLLWTERYGAAGNLFQERIGVVSFGLALTLLAVGAAVFLRMQAFFADAVSTALRAL